MAVPPLLVMIDSTLEGSVAGLGTAGAAVISAAATGEPKTAWEKKLRPRARTPNRYCIVRSKRVKSYC